MKQVLFASHQLFIAILNLLYALIINFSIKRALSFSNFLKLGLVYILSLVLVIIIDFDFSENFWSKLLTGKLSDQRISIYGVKDRIGEGRIYDRLRVVASKKGIDYSGVRFSEELSHFWLTEHLYTVAASLINYAFKPQFNFAVTHHVSILPRGYNITYLNMPTSWFYEPTGEFMKKWQHLSRYDAYADLYTYAHGDNPALKEAMRLNNHQNKKIIPVYIAQDQLDYSPVNIEKLIVTGSLWGCGRGSLRITDALKKLAAEDLLVAYGLKGYFKFLDRAYQGRLEDSGNIENNLIAIQKEYGIALVIHNLEHMLEGIPTNRISEAAASGALIISDNNSFVHKFFGNNVLYFDSLGSAEQIYQQIKTHIVWAQNNSDAALDKTKRAYDIFDQHFTMEKQLDHLIKEVSRTSSL